MMRRHYGYDPDYDYDYDEPEGTSGICSACGEACTSVMVDEGIGSYEYWGATGTHHEWQEVSPCCHEEVVDGGEKVIRSSEHTARRDHKDGSIKKNDHYRVTVTFHWRAGGAGWITESKRVLDRFRSAVKAGMTAA